MLAGTIVVSTGASTLTGDLGVSPGGAVVGFPPGNFTGTVHAADAVASTAQIAVQTAYNDLSAQACNVDLTGQDLGGLTLTPGVYCFATSAQLTGTLTLDAQGDSNAVFIFKIGNTLTTASNSVVNVIGSGQNGNVFWRVGSSATLGANTAFKGNVLALTSITLTTGASLNGRDFGTQRFCYFGYQYRFSSHFHCPYGSFNIHPHPLRVGPHLARRSDGGVGAAAGATPSQGLTLSGQSGAQAIGVQPSSPTRQCEP
ncbi:MAG: ice-binding family protein [Rhodoferax sp.]